MPEDTEGRQTNGRRLWNEYHTCPRPCTANACVPEDCVHTNRRCDLQKHVPIDDDRHTDAGNLLVTLPEVELPKECAQIGHKRVSVQLDDIFQHLRGVVTQSHVDALNIGHGCRVWPRAVRPRYGAPQSSPRGAKSPQNPRRRHHQGLHPRDSCRLYRVAPVA